MSGEFIQMAMSKGLLPDEFVDISFQFVVQHPLLIDTKLTYLPVPYERREELSSAYYRIIKVCKCFCIELPLLFTN